MKLVSLVALFGCAATVLAQEPPPPGYQPPAGTQQPAFAPEAPAPAFGTPPPSPLGLQKLHLTVVSQNPHVVLEKILWRNSFSGIAFSSDYGYPTAVSNTARQPLCQVPCNLEVDVNAQYRIDGDGVNPSGAFWLPKEPSVALNVKAGSKGMRIAGKILTWVGAGFTTAGLVSFGLSALASAPTAKTTGDPVDVFLDGGLLLTGVGVPMLVAGTIMWASSGTQITTDTGQTLGSLERPSLPLL
ncbi:MAG: hypothetical protein ACYDCL_03740 [Myxococcales bacterium]